MAKMPIRNGIGLEFRFRTLISTATDNFVRPIRIPFVTDYWHLPIEPNCEAT